MTRERAASRVSAREFKAIYWIGFLASVGVAFAAAANPVDKRWSILLLVLSLGHMILLVAAGFFTAREYRGSAGSRVGTMGYLYTLVGFTVALMQLPQGQSFSIRELLPPLATALITSIIGWFFGGEIAGVEAAELSLESEAEKVAAEMRGFAHAIRAGHEDYLRIVSDAGSRISLATTQITEFFDEAGRLQKDFSERARSNTEALFETILAEYKATAASWKDVTAAAKKNSDAASSASAKIATDFDRVARAVDDTRTHLEKTATKLREHFGEDLSETMRALTANAQSARDEMKELAKASQDVTRYLNESEKLITAMEKLLHAISASRRAAV